MFLRRCIEGEQTQQLKKVGIVWVMVSLVSAGIQTRALSRTKVYQEKKGNNNNGGTKKRRVLLRRMKRASS